MSKNRIVSLAAVTAASTAARSAADKAAVDQAFAALPAYDRGSSRGALLALDEAVRASLGDAAARAELERRLLAVLEHKLSLVGIEYVCGKLGLIGSANSVLALAKLLADRELAHVAGSALAALPAPAADQALRDSLPKLEGLRKVGVINALGDRRDLASVPALCISLREPDVQVAGATAAALGCIGTVGAAEALKEYRAQAPEAIRAALADACLVCAERLLGEGKTAEARALYRILTAVGEPKNVRLAAERGLAAAGMRE